MSVDLCFVYVASSQRIGIVRQEIQDTGIIIIIQKNVL